jgi:Fe-Mn family superoxide dismutase
MNRRDTLKLVLGTTVVAGGGAMTGRGSACTQAPAGPFTLPPLGYAYEALEPHIDTATMGFHHKNHHGTYVNNLNGLVEKWPDLAKKAPEEIFANLSMVPEPVRAAVRNNLGGHWNHSFFWTLMTPGGAKAPSSEVASAISGAFGSFDAMKAAIKQAGTTRFGSGWAWLAVGKDRKLTAFNTP